MADTKLFLRQTTDPATDIRRGFSGNVNAWFESEHDALVYQQRG